MAENEAPRSSSGNDLSAQVTIPYQEFKRLLDAASVAVVEKIFHELEREALRRFGSLKREILFGHAVDMRYAGQEHTVATPFEPGAGFDALLAAFHAAHEKAYTFRLPDTKAELVTFHLTAEIDTPRVGLPEIGTKGTAADAVNRPARTPHQRRWSRARAGL